MKQYYNWPIAAGIAGGMIARGFFWGAFFGVLFGIIIGIPLYYAASFVIRRLFKNDRKANLVTVSISCLIMIVSPWFLFHPPARWVFKGKLANPIPSSVEIIKAKSICMGPDGASYLKFTIGKSDLEQIVKEKGFEPAEIVATDLDDFVVLEIKSASKSIKFSLPDFVPWFKVEDIENTEAYLIEDEDHCMYTYIIYDPNTTEALYEFSTY